MFAWFCIYAYRKFVRYEEVPPDPRKSGAVTEIPAGLLPERPKPAQQPPDDPALREYNAYLAELAEERCRKTEQDHRMTTPETPEAHAPAVPVDKIRTALLGYRIMAWTTGLWLIALCYEIVSHVAFHHEIRWIEVVHGWVYFVYVLAAFNLAIKVRWPIGKTIGVLLSGTIPLLGIIVEHFQTKDVKARFGL